MNIFSAGLEIQSNNAKNQEVINLEELIHNTFQSPSYNALHQCFISTWNWRLNLNVLIMFQNVK